MIVSRVLIDQRPSLRLRRREVSSNRTGNPMPPTMMATQMGTMTAGSPTKPIRLSLNNANPALLKAETAWKMPYQTAVPQSSV